MKLLLLWLSVILCMGLSVANIIEYPLGYIPHNRTASISSDQPPSNTRCTTVTSQIIHMSWDSPPLESVNGVVKGYKVVYAPSEFWNDKNYLDYKETDSTDIVLRGLEKYTNYTMQVLATTLVGDGVRSQAIHCQTEQDVPEAPMDVKSLVISSETILVSWQEPTQPNGNIILYTVYYKPKGSDEASTSRRVNPNQMRHEVSEIATNQAYEFWVTASTIIGEGATSKTHITETNKVSNEHELQSPDVQKFLVNVKPQSPAITLAGITTDSLTLKLKPHEGDVAPLHGYTLHYKPEFGEWETVDVAVDAQKYSIENLYCGSRYQVYSTGYNNVGPSEPSNILNTRTSGSKPVQPEKLRFIELSSNSVTLHLDAWEDGGCQMLFFVVENKRKDQIGWNLISNNVKPKRSFVILNMEPAAWYNLRVTAHNSAGFTVAEYEFATLTEDVTLF